MQFAQFPLVSHDAWTYPLLWRHANVSLFIDYSTYSEKTELSRHLARRHKKTRWRLVLCTTILIHGPIFIHEALPTPIKTVLQCRAEAHLRNFSYFVFGLVLVRSIYSSLTRLTFWFSQSLYCFLNVHFWNSFQIVSSLFSLPSNNHTCAVRHPNRSLKQVGRFGSEWNIVIES